MPKVTIKAALGAGNHVATVFANVDGSNHFLVRAHGWMMNGPEPVPEFMLASAVAKYGFTPVEPNINVEVDSLRDLEDVLPDLIKATCDPE